MIKSIIASVALLTSSLAFASPTYTVVSGPEAEAEFNKRTGVMVCNGNTCSWTDPDQVSTPYTIVTTCSANVTWKRGAGSETAIPDTAICFLQKLN